MLERLQAVSVHQLKELCRLRGQEIAATDPYDILEAAILSFWPDIDELVLLH